MVIDTKPSDDQFEGLLQIGQATQTTSFMKENKDLTNLHSKQYPVVSLEVYDQQFDYNFDREKPIFTNDKLAVSRSKGCTMLLHEVAKDTDDEYHYNLHAVARYRNDDQTNSSFDDQPMQ